MNSGLWQHNPALVRVLGVAPLLAVSTSMVKAVSLALILLLVLCVSNVLVSLTRHWVPIDVRMPFYALLFATLVSIIDMGLQANVYELHQALGIYLPVIAGSALLLSRAEECAVRTHVLSALSDAWAYGVGMLAVFTVLGFSRELLGAGTVLADIELLGVADPVLQTIYIDMPAKPLVFALPAGALIGLGLLAALANRVSQRLPKDA